MEQDGISKIIEILSHPIRREILVILSEKGDKTFTELLTGQNIDTGKLSFHLRKLQPLITQKENGKYGLNRAGEDAVRVLKDIESWAELANIEKQSPQPNLASFSIRAFAFLIDFSISIAIATVLQLEIVFTQGPRNWIILLVNLLFTSLAILFIYSTLFEGFRGQTIGKSMFDLLVTQMNNKKLTYEHAAIRNFGKLLLPFDLLLGYMLHDPKYIRYFDKIARTIVIDLKKARPQKKTNKTESGPSTGQNLPPSVNG